MTQLIEYLQQNSTALYSVVFVFGLLFGSFFNVVIYRLPIIMNRQWYQMSEAFLDEQKCTINCPDDAKQELGIATKKGAEPAKFNLITPDSTCPQCQHKIRSWENIPVISYLFLRGKCSSCKKRISLRYPMVELFTALVFLFVAMNTSPDWSLLVLLLFSSILIILTGIDIDHQLLPDTLVYSLLWLGLFCSVIGLTIPPATAIIGALAGYLSLWSIFWIFKLVTQKDGMGYGDFKLLAALGAWLGWQLLLPLMVIASVLGAVVGISSMLLFKSSNKIPFGPYLAVAGWVMMFWGDDIVHAYLVWANLA
jgi:leader peptidase (prepilin peptidase)/N-methyltransferase